jgi:hypothetical protein
MACLELFYAIFIVFFVSRRQAHRRVRRFLAGQCLRCGYDIQKLEVCPECGTPRGNT